MYTPNKPCQVVPVDPAENRENANQISFDPARNVIRNVLVDPFVRRHELGLVDERNLGGDFDVAIGGHRDGQRCPVVVRRSEATTARRRKGEGKRVFPVRDCLG
jgi:hypothetical protein